MRLQVDSGGKHLTWERHLLLEVLTQRRMREPKYEAGDMKRVTVYLSLNLPESIRGQREEGREEDHFESFNWIFNVTYSGGMSEVGRCIWMRDGEYWVPAAYRSLPKY